MRTLWNGLEPYAQLIGSLLPRAAGVAVFDAAGDLRWSNDDGGCTDLGGPVAESRQRAGATGDGELVLLPGNLPAYVFWLREDTGRLLALVGIPWKQPEADPRPFTTVQAFVRPALEALRRELLSRTSIASLTSALDARDRDVELLLNSSGDDPTGETGDELAFVLQSAATHLHCQFAALIVPDRNLVVLRAPEGRRIDTAVLAKTHRHLMSLSQVHADPVILNDVSALPGLQSLAYRVVVAPVRQAGGRGSGGLVLFRAGTDPEFVEREARLLALLARRCGGLVEASYDPLSGLLNRAAFEQRCRTALGDTGKARPWTAIYLDVDRLHVINDNFGMHIGDRLITRVGDLIRASLVPGAHAARVSGDRFSILLPCGQDDAVAFAEALCERIAQTTAVSLGATDSRSFSASSSIGVAAVSDARVSFAHAFAVAEMACKAAKDRGRNRVELYEPNDASMVRRFEDVNLAPSLRLAIAENRLRLDAQLIVPLAGARVSKPHFELLLRMIGEDGETVGPDRFLSAAIRYQLMPMVDRWVVTTALQQLQPHAALLADRPVVFTLNLSGQSLGDPAFGDFVVDSIAKSGLNPRVLCFEITESAAITNLAKAEELMGKLRRLGCELALDDFGTGLSSLAYLRQLPVDMLKIDGSFVRDVLKDPRAASMIEAIAALARTMKLVTVAEYVETHEIRDRVAALGVDYGQGFSIARPVPLTEVLVELPMYATARPVDPAGRDTLADSAIDAVLDAGIDVTIEQADDDSPAAA